MSGSITVEVIYYAIFRDMTLIEREQLQTHCSTYRELYTELADRYQFPLQSVSIQVAVNDEFVDLDQAPTDGDQIVFIPPVSGG
ncbi:MAG: MoaD/ThiS family protein [Synechococcaceae cyanobacterium SM2_3_2]|nr:MoaD/ThiS family protein [Synechococcaceae cyanobacterium SM2_3_2]